MEWLFEKDAANWPEHFIYALEFAFVVCSVIAYSATRAIDQPKSGLRTLIVGIGTVVGAVAISFPILLAPFFFFVRGEWMMATIPAMVIVFPLALFITHTVFKSG